MRRTVLILGVVAAAAVGAFLYSQSPSPRAINPDDLSALRLQAADLQRAVETLARSSDPDPAELAALAERLKALNARLDQLQGSP